MAMMETLETLLEPHGLLVLGGFAVTPEDRAPAPPGGGAARFCAMIGNAGSAMWAPFSAARRPEPHPLNAWNRRVLDPIAARLGAAVAYPFDEPFQPFPRWAERTGTIFATPMTPAIHPVYGPWFALRGALFTAAPLCPPTPPATSPCESCADKPCLSACPSGAIQAKDGAICQTYLEPRPESDCVTHACRARRSCPVGRAYAYEPAHARFHMEAFVREFGEVMRKWRESAARTPS